MPYKNIFLIGIFIVFVWSCSSDDDSQLFLEKYDMTLWKNVMNSCGAMAPLNHQPYLYTQHYFMRFEKNHNGYVRFFEPSYPENSCEQAYWECWKLRRISLNDVQDPNSIEIISQTEDFINYNIGVRNIQLNYNNDMLRMRIEDCCGRVTFKSYVKSDMEFDMLNFCD